MVYDLIRLASNIEVKGIDISEYAIKNAIPEVKDFLKAGSAEKLNYKDNSFILPHKKMIFS